MRLESASFLLLLFGLLLCQAAWAQELSPVVANQLGTDRLLLDLTSGEEIPDTTEPWRYFPLEIGNTWEYLQTDGRYQRRYVEKDTLIEGTHYFIVNSQNFSAEGEPGSLVIRNPFRFDTLTARIMRRNNPLFGDCSFDLPFGSTCHKGTIAVGGGYDHLLVFPTSAGADSIYTAVKTLADIHEEFRYAADFGEVFYYCSECGFGWGLQAVRIGGWDGEVYGELQFPPQPVFSEESPSAERFALSVWPNPFRERFTASIRVDEPAPVLLVVYDLLGREVLRRDLGTLPPGENAIPVEMHSLPPGPYVLRVEIGERHLTSVVLTKVR